MSRIQKAITFADEMLCSRGYKKDDHDPFIYHTSTNKLRIFFCTGQKLNIELMKSLVAQLQKEEIFHSIIVHDHVITSSTKKLLDHLWDIEIELFHLDELQYNITKHCLYSVHEKVENADDLKKIKPSLKKLPVILKTDPVIRYFNFSKNDVIRIYRRDGSISYRVVH